MATGNGTGKGNGTGSGAGPTGGAGRGYRVEVEQLRAFAAQVRLLLAEFQHHADGTATHGRSGIGPKALGTFAEATDLHGRYQIMRDGLRDALDQLQEAIDEAQKKAELTATNYEEQEHLTRTGLKLGDDGWSVANPSAASTAAYARTTAPARNDDGKGVR
ncbi:hypothetical protein SAMN05216371_5010 [Streptomyces sp. TLI_053]|uniref:hypothetical protein n=1 Tax=Streptomyces sp. TLI_053 TaxID=1855352 RepID=UPI00087D2100|nr:hypothetical protein [Streptomyces sp. TLI_053]SDT75704.1 hypothetical protein SAMN05216371_5010 [Streptomyces sp. TLI_053]